MILGIPSLMLFGNMRAGWMLWMLPTVTTQTRQPLASLVGFASILFLASYKLSYFTATNDIKGNPRRGFAWLEDGQPVAFWPEGYESIGQCLSRPNIVPDVRCFPASPLPPSATDGCSPFRLLLKFPTFAIFENENHKTMIEAQKALEADHNWVAERLWRF